MGWSFWLKLIVTLLTFAIAAIEFGFIKKIKKEKVKKRWIGSLFVVLILFTIWDSTKESIDNSKESTKRDALIKDDSLRALKIITNLENSLDSIAITKNEIVKVDSILKGVKDSLRTQLILLNEATRKSKELVDLENKVYYDRRPLLTSSSADLKITLSDTTDTHELFYPIFNTGLRPASNIVIRDAIIFSDKLWDRVIYEYVMDDELLINNMYPGTNNLITTNHSVVFKKQILNKPNTLMLLVIKIDFKDKSLNRMFTDFMVFKYDEKSNEGKFNGTSQTLRNEAIRYVNENGLFKN